MTAEFSPHLTSASSLEVLAQAYGTNAYSSNSYNGQSATGTTATPLPPNTGLYLPSSMADIALLLGLAVVVGSASYTMSRLAKRRRGSK